MYPWPNLTRIANKPGLYERETYFREGWAAVQDASHSPDALDRTLRRTALLMLKPDGLAAGKLGRTHDFLREQGFDVVGVREVGLSRFTVRELWRYQLTSATLDRLAVSELLMAGRVGLLLVLRSTEGPDGVPATVRLASLKGSSTVAEQASGSLRNLLGQPNRVLSYVHVTDEPADLVRELPILLDAANHRTLAKALATGTLPDDDRRLLDSALQHDLVGGRSMELDDAVAAVEDALFVRLQSRPDLRSRGERLLGELGRMGSGERVAWREFVRDLAEVSPELDRWDLAVLGTHVIVYDEPGASKLIANPRWSDWLAPVR